MVIVGDFNAKVGKRTNEKEKRAIGNFALGERNDNGEELVNFAMENELLHYEHDVPEASKKIVHMDIT